MSRPLEPAGLSELRTIARDTSGLRLLLLFGSRARGDAQPGDDAFRLEAARFWCDARPVLERAYENVLSDLSA